MVANNNQANERKELDDNKINFFNNIAMCQPAAPALMWASLAASAVSAGAGYMAEKQTAKSQNAFAEAQAKQGEINAKNALIMNTNQETQKALQEDQADSFELQRIHRERLQKQGEAVASKSYVGTNLDQIWADYEQQEAMYHSAIKQEADFKAGQSQAAMKGYGAQYTDRVASYAYTPVQSPSLVGAAAGLGTKAIGTYYTFKNMKEKGN